MTRQRWRIAVLLLTAATPVVFGQTTTTPAAARVLRVTSAADDGSSGTLRWAIDASNATPDRERVEIDLPPGVPHVIVLKSALPPVRGPVQIEGVAWRRNGEHMVIDGSGYIAAGGPESCPGATAGQYGANVRTMTGPGLQLIDTDDVEIAGVEIRRFCIGVLVNRSPRVAIRDSRIVENRGGAGVMLTGDDGQGNPTSTTTVHNTVLRTEFVDNGDGLELTRGAAFNVVADNEFRSTGANPEPAQGIEILRGNDNVVSGNRFDGYSDGLQINWGDRNYIVANTFTNNTFGLNLTGLGNVVDSNVITGNRVGIAVRPAEPSPVVRLTRNRISGNGRDIMRCEAGGSCDPHAPKGAMAFGVPGLEHAGFVGSRGRGVSASAATLQYICPDAAPRCQPAPNGGVRPPTLLGAHVDAAEMTVTGTIAGTAASRYVVELFGNTDRNSAEAEVFVAQAPAYTDASGHGTFTLRVPRSGESLALQSVTATMTSAAGATSPLSAAYVIDSADRPRRSERR
jgi:3-dehydroshikimate dehydratase